jgi:hypothetical protein
MFVACTFLLLLLIGLAATATARFRIAMPQRIVIFVNAQFLTSFGPIGFAWVIKRSVVFTTAISFGGDDRELKMFIAWLKQHKQNFENETLVGEVWVEKLTYRPNWRLAWAVAMPIPFGRPPA